MEDKYPFSGIFQDAPGARASRKVVFQAAQDAKQFRVWHCLITWPLFPTSHEEPFMYSYTMSCLGSRNPQHSGLLCPIIPSRDAQRLQSSSLRNAGCSQDFLTHFAKQTMRIPHRGVPVVNLHSLKRCIDISPQT